MTDSNNSDYSDPELDEEDEEENDEYWKPESQTAPPLSGGVGTPTAARYQSVCKPYTASMYARIYKVPPEYDLCAPTNQERAQAPPRGYAAIYAHHFQNGLSLPLPPFVVSVLAYYQISLAQLHPNCIITLLGFLGVCKLESIVPTTTLFRHFFQLQRSEQCAEGWYTFQARGSKIASCLEGWKSSFLFFKTAPISENLTLEWNYSPIVDMLIGENERPSEQMVSRLKRKRVEDSSMVSVTRMRMADASTQTTPVLDYSDPELQIMSPSNIEAAAYSSICTPSTAKYFAETYEVPPEFGLCAPTPEERAHAPPPGFTSIYTHHFLNGLRLPLPPFVVSILAHYKIALTQLHPNCIICLVGFMQICKKISIAPTPALFRYFFKLVRNKRLKAGWYTFQQRIPKIVHGQPTRVEGWKKYFLYFKTAPMTGNLTLSWNYNCMFPPLSQHEWPSAETIRKFLDNVVVYPFKSAEEERMIGASILKSYSLKKKVVTEMEAEKASKENEPTGVSSEERLTGASILKSCSSEAVTEMEAERSSKVNEPILSTESLSAACMVKGMATKECVGGSLQVPSLPSLKDLNPEQFACFVYLLQGEKEELEKLVPALKQGIKDKNIEIDSLQELLEKVVATMERKDKEIALLKSENSRLKSVSNKENLEKVVAAMERSVKVKDKEISLLKSENSRLKNVCDDRGLLLNVYTWKLLKTKAFARFFKDLRTSVRSLGRHEAAEVMRSHCPDIPEEAFVGLEDPQAASKLKNQFFDMIQDDGFEFPLLDHLLSLAEIPSSYHLKNLEVDEDKDGLEVV